MGKLFLVDDHAVVREGLRALLEGAGHRVVGEADEPTAAVAGVMQTRPDLVLLDLSLGGSRSGLEVLEDLARRKAGVPVLVLSMSSQPRTVADAMRLGARGYVLKGSPSARVLEAIRTILAGRSYLTDDEAVLALQGLTDKEATWDDLSSRERQILVMVARGYSSTEIGIQLHLSAKTVDTYRSRMMAKLGLGDVAGVVRWAIRNGLVSAEE
ncbi:response regulator transcription factor [Ramlibacter rhizophilus]|uniref:Response regulator transcription factor n=1 Tax=Ramlibacter rhizophilus TaxID=1781167 RepID=A0A4Z0BKR3_9BURK|nr:response regulator transcription factor [Ramlibacter rhizophilus]TFY98684.1 response regulator transcription factor [Ramlibacter rhizophilus]